MGVHVEKQKSGPEQHQCLFRHCPRLLAQSQLKIHKDVPPRGRECPRRSGMILSASYVTLTTPCEQTMLKLSSSISELRSGNVATLLTRMASGAFGPLLKDLYNKQRK